jgi:N,N'-diacetylchitobiose phosphorylase
MNDKEAAIAHEHRLANDRYQLTISHDGTGSSHFGALAITRRVPDRTRETDAFVLYVRDLDNGEYWSAGAEPVRLPGDSYEAIARDGLVTLVREHDGIRTTLEVALVANAPAEERRLTIENLSGRARRLDVTTYAELVLNTPAADASHPAFSKLFVQTEWDDARQALLAMRRLRATDDEPLWVIHTLRTVERAPKLAWETDRMRFIGRGRTNARPKSLDAGAELSATTGAVLDPIFALRAKVTLAPDASIQLIALLGAGHTRDEVISIIAERGTPVAQRLSPRRAHGDSGALESRPADRYRAAHAPKSTMVASSDEQLRFFNGIGGFSSDGTEYVIRLDATPTGLRWPPMPWSNVIANENAGCIVTGSGAVTSWTANSRENRLTPWFNDPVSDPYGEAIYLRDEDSGVFWSPLPGPTPAPAPYEVRHGFGYTSWKHTSHELEQSATTWMPRLDPVKFVRLTLRNTSARSRTITVMSYAHLVLGGVPWNTAPHVVTARDASTGAILATNPSRGEFSKRVAFATLVAPADAGAIGAISATGDRTAFLGRTGSVGDPAAIHSDALLDGRMGAGLDPCAAFSTTITIPSGGTVEIAFLLGEAESEDRARALLRTYGKHAAINDSLDHVRAFWRDTLDGVQIETPSPALDLMVNGWLAYQNLACRVWGRSAYYQSGGAFGFRDQLQDSAALLYLDPSLTRSQILLHAAHQFVEGDVMHWWHPPTSKGIRTRFSDDLLWLPYITAFYVASTGDTAVLDASAPFVTGPQLVGEEDELFMTPTDSGTAGSVYEHCCRAIDRSLTAGAHGIPLMGSGDWNDGMNRVGREGKGESVWLGFFLFAILEDFIPLAEARGDSARVSRFRTYQENLGEALNGAGWDGGWYRRAYYDDGTPLGTSGGDECRIDAIAQAWSVLSGAAPADRAEIALDAMEQHLVSEQEKLIRLLTPAFDKTPHDPGYIKGYLPGVRENGGQYTHGVLWGVRALAEMGRTERATKLLEMLSPITHARTPAEVEVYRVEPYVIAADVYGVAPHVGRGGWTWYTGSAGWMYRVALESLLGLTIVAGTRLELRPCIPESWPGFSVRMRLADKRTRYEIVLTRAAAGVSETQVHVDGELLDDVVADGAASIALVRDGGVHLVEIALANDLTPRYAPASTAP